MSDAPWKDRTKAEVVECLKSARSLDDLPADLIAKWRYAAYPGTFAAAALGVAPGGQSMFDALSAQGWEFPA